MRYRVVFALFLLSMITYIDRVSISTAKTPIAAELSVSDSGMGLVFGAFALGYALAQIPAGWFADKAGVRVALAAVVSAWSFLTALTGAAWSLASLVVIRFSFGVAEAGAFPGSARAIRDWLPPAERGRANGVLFSGSRLGAAFAFPLLAWMLARWQWRMAFLVLGLLGAAWAIAWLLWFRDRSPKALAAEAEAGAVAPSRVVVAPPSRRQGPATQKGTRLGGETPALQHLRSQAPVPLRNLLRSRAIARAMAQYFAGNFTFFICLSWMLPHLKREYQLNDVDAAKYAMAPLLLGAASQWLAGWMVDFLYRSRWRAWSRRVPGMLGFALAAIGVLGVTRAATPATAVVCFTLAAFGADMTISPSWVYCADIAGGNTGSVSGAMNMVGNFGSFVSANAFPYLQRLTGSASTYFFAAAVLNLGGIWCWFRMRSVDVRSEP